MSVTVQPKSENTHPDVDTTRILLQAVGARTGDVDIIGTFLTGEAAYQAKESIETSFPEASVNITFGEGVAKLRVS